MMVTGPAEQAVLVAARISAALTPHTSRYVENIPGGLRFFLEVDLTDTRSAPSSGDHRPSV
ncbi:hypothetical protein BIV57_00710 [Mangrovactinospora gilvigrisea]|uniref:Uncharacterized protein n=1 Tax=Mangrovactinospora gilvigrisea TaxID=1428644 RepID=A0A1J7CCW9_9ACTN|nr:hypothetical protein BIV57_00710 [Mangrovactinospora gilvigrisea]